MDVLKKVSEVVKKNKGDLTILTNVLEGLNIRSATAFLQLASNYDRFSELVSTSYGDLDVLNNMVKENTQSITGYITALRELVTGPFKLAGFTDIAQSFFKTLFETLSGSNVPKQLGEMVAHILILLRNNLPDIIRLIETFTSNSSALFGILQAGVIVLNTVVDVMNAFGPAITQGALSWYLMSRAFGLANINLQALAVNLRQAQIEMIGVNKNSVVGIQMASNLRVAWGEMAMAAGKISAAMFMMGMVSRDLGQMFVQLALIIATQLVPQLIALYIAKSLTWAAAAPYLLPVAIGAIAMGLGFYYGESERAREQGRNYNYNVNEMNIYTNDADKWRREFEDGAGG